MIIENACCSGYCSKGFSHTEVAKCIAGAKSDWNGLCGYQNGNPIDRIPDTKVTLTCCREGCEMFAYQYASWNGLCGYQRNEIGDKTK